MKPRIKTLTKIVVISGLVALLAGCEPEPIKPTSINAELNGDGYKDSLTLEQIDGTWDDYQVTSTVSNGDGTYAKPKRVLRINNLSLRKDPYSVDVELMNGDDHLDLVVIRPFENSWDDFEKVVCYGNGDGTFSEPVQIQYLKDYGSSL
ncbi:hypothetical protein ACFL2V_16305 [Pseudomonadota bacterium]